MGWLMGFEPTISWATSKCFKPLSYSHHIQNYSSPRRKLGKLISSCPNETDYFLRATSHQIRAMTTTPIITHQYHTINLLSLSLYYIIIPLIGALERISLDHTRDKLPPDLHVSRKFCFAPEGIRTPDLYVRSVALYPLSYGRKILRDKLRVALYPLS